MGVAHFASLGAEVEPVLVRDRASADDPANAQAIGEADLVYLSGGKPAYLLSALAGSAVGRAMVDANERGAVLAGCSAGAMALAGHAFDFRVKLMPWPLRWGIGLGFAPRHGRGPALRRLAGAVLALIALQAPRESVVIGVDEETAVVGQRRCLAGPRPFTGHGLARPPTRAVPRRGGLPDLMLAGDRVVSRSRQSGRTVRKQSEQ